MAILVGMRPTSKWIAIVTMLGMLSGAAACGTEQAPVCSSADAVRDSVDHLRDANLSENGLTYVQSGLDQLRRDIQQFNEAARTQFAAEITAVKSAADVLSTNVTAAKASPSATTLAAVGTAITALRDSYRHLADTVASTC